MLHVPQSHTQTWMHSSRMRTDRGLLTLCLLAGDAVVPRGTVGRQLPPPCAQTNMSKYITFPQLRLRAVKSFFTLWAGKKMVHEVC